MKELSLNILDVAKNSVRAGATKISINVSKDAEGILTLTIIDNGCGMDAETLKRVTDPFYTTRKTRGVGLGVPLLKLAAEQTGGTLKLSSSVEEGTHGTVLEASFDTKSIDCMPMGDIVSTICILIAGSPDIDFDFTDTTPEGVVELYTAQLREVLGDISLAEPEIQVWMTEYLNDQYSNRKNLEK